jgi:hypothetical protein
MSVLSPDPPVDTAGAVKVALGGSAATDAEKWAAWDARGKAHDRAVRRKMMVVAPIAVTVIAALVWYLV